VPGVRRALGLRKITRDVNGAIAKERANLRDPDARAEFWAERIADCERRRAKNQEMYHADAMSLLELKAENSRIDGERETAETELARLRDAGRRVDLDGRDLPSRCPERLCDPGSWTAPASKASTTWRVASPPTRSWTARRHATRPQPPLPVMASSILR
jgi:hypothetical protein